MLKDRYLATESEERKRHTASLHRHPFALVPRSVPLKRNSSFVYFHTQDQFNPLLSLRESVPSLQHKTALKELRRDQAKQQSCALDPGTHPSLKERRLSGARFC